MAHYATTRQIAGSSTDNVFRFFFFWSFQLHYDPGVDSASYKNEYQDCFQEMKAAGA